jgi:hypothetical protein
VANRGADTLGRRGQQDALGRSALIVGVQIGNLWVDDNGDSGGRGREMAGVGAFDRRQAAKHRPIADHDEFQRLTIAGAPRPLSNFEDVAQGVFRQWVRSQLTNRAQAARSKASMLEAEAGLIESVISMCL